MHNPEADARLIQVWNEVLEMIPADARRQLHGIVADHATVLADAFYADMLADPDAGRMLDHAIVNQRLHASMMRWLVQLFDPSATVEAKVAAQRLTGEVHARIGVPISMVANGARTLKRRIVQQLARARPSGALAFAIQQVYELIDIAIDTMTVSYDSNATRMARSDESYRLHFLTQNLKTERERQKSHLLEWAHQILVRNYWSLEEATAGGERGADPRSQFELWLQHKASMLFEQSPQLPWIRERVARIHGTLLPELHRVRAHPDEARRVFAEVHREVEGLKDVLNQMFDEATDLEEARDGLTQLLHRRYFPTVAKREILLAQAAGTRFALLKVDIDRFETVGEALGTEASDAALAQVAESLADGVRAGDFVFRVGQDQFLMLIVEIDAAAALSLAQAVRERIARLQLRAVPGAAPSLTVSVGVAVFDGHPDYQRLLDRAEAALRQARLAGGHRVELAPPTT